MSMTKNIQDLIFFLDGVAHYKQFTFNVLKERVRDIHYKSAGTVNHNAWFPFI